MIGITLVYKKAYVYNVGGGHRSTNKIVLLNLETDTGLQTNLYIFVAGRRQDDKGLQNAMRF